MMSELELDEVLTLRWPVVLRRVMADSQTEGFVRSFARSIAHHAKRPQWRPTPKQERLMRELLGQFYSAPDGGDDFDLIETD